MFSGGALFIVGGMLHLVGATLNSGGHATFGGCALICGGMPPYLVGDHHT